MLGKIKWPWLRQGRAVSTPVELDVPSEPTPPSPLFVQTSNYRFQSVLQDLFRPYLDSHGCVTLDGRVLSLEQICQDSGLLGAWVALADVKVREEGKLLVTRWGRHGGLVDLIPLCWRSDQVSVDELFVDLVAPLLSNPHIELGGVFLPVAEAAALGQITGVPPCILRWKHPEGADRVPLVKPKPEFSVLGMDEFDFLDLPEFAGAIHGLNTAYRSPEANDLAAAVSPRSRHHMEHIPVEIPAAPSVSSVAKNVVGRRFLWCNTGVPPVRQTELDLYEATVKRLEQGLDVVGWPSPDVWRGLRQEFPWALAACQEIEKLAELAHFVKQPAFRLPPILLVGSPGNGKTRLAERLAELAGVPRFAISGAGRNNGQMLVGVGRSWSNGQPGGLLQFIAKRGVANPLVVLDELDKAAQQTQYGDLASALLPFLEPENARVVTDDFLMGETDMSGVSWVATANDASVLPGPLLSRFKIIEVGHPSWEHLPVLCAGIRQDLARQFEVPVGNLPELGATDLARLRKQMGPTFSARQARLACEALLAERARMGRLEMVR